MTEQKKRRQGQRGATPKPECPKCGELLRRCYMRGSEEKSRAYMSAGWICPSPTCDHIIKDIVELEDIQEEEQEEKGDKAEKIKKLTGEFLKTHERLNELAEQIKELETE